MMKGQKVNRRWMHLIACIGNLTRKTYIENRLTNPGSMLGTLWGISIIDLLLSPSSFCPECEGHHDASKSKEIVLGKKVPSNRKRRAEGSHSP
jgi:hypothetical protein